MTIQVYAPLLVAICIAVFFLCLYLYSKGCRDGYKHGYASGLYEGKTLGFIRGCSVTDSLRGRTNTPTKATPKPTRRASSSATSMPRHDGLGGVHHPAYMHSSSSDSSSSSSSSSCSSSSSSSCGGGGD